MEGTLEIKTQVTKKIKPSNGGKTRKNSVLLCKITRREEMNPKHKGFLVLSQATRTQKEFRKKKRQKELDISLVTEQEV